MIVINIAKDFTTTPGFRTYEDGKYSGKEFYDTLLKIKYEEAIDKNEKLQIILDGTEGYTSSFLNEAFRLLGSEFGADKSWNQLVLISNEVPKYLIKVKESVYEQA